MVRAARPPCRMFITFTCGGRAAAQHSWCTGPPEHIITNPRPGAGLGHRTQAGQGCGQWSLRGSGSSAVLVSPSSSALSSCYLGCNHLSSIADIKWVLWWSVSTGYSIQGRWPVSTGQYTGCRGQLSSGRVPGQQWQCRAVGGWSHCRQHVMVSVSTVLTLSNSR